MKSLELLAPAGDMEVLKSAVFAGADAVYIGGKEFNARENANNFTRDEIKEAVSYCHLYGVKVYVAINILIKDEEIKSVMEFVHFLYNHYVDALIVQDLGLFYLLKKDFPQMSIHSSTQMFIHSLHGVLLLEELGFDRIVLARELTNREIKEIVKNSTKEIKIFNHGAMCICYSGQCLMSSIIGGRSGNRGNCAQPCRKEYKLFYKNEEKDSGHLLSPKDMNTMENFYSILDTGAHSIKIEGRKKNAVYVYNVVSAYRKLIDSAKTGGANGLTDSEKYKITQAFNREFTSGYIEKEKLSSEELINKTSPKNQGIYIGIVSNVDKEYITISLIHNLNIGDGIRFVRDKFETGEVIRNLYTTNKEAIKEGKPQELVMIINNNNNLKKDDKVYKIKDIKMEEEIKEILNNQYPYKYKIKGKFIFHNNQPIRASIQWDEIIAEYIGDKSIEKANHRATDKSRIREQLTKLGDTPFVFNELNIDMDKDINIPISNINKARRSIIDKLVNTKIKLQRSEIKEIQEYKKILGKSLDFSSYNDQRLALKTDDLDFLKEIIDAPVDEVIFGGDISLDLKAMERAVEICNTNNKRCIITFPRVTRNKYLAKLSESIEEIKKLKCDGVVVSNYELLSIFLNTGLKIQVDEGFNILNSYTLEQLKVLGVSHGYLSPELKYQEIQYLIAKKPMSLGLVVYSNRELMISEYRISKEDKGYLKDKRGYTFPVGIDDFGRSHIYNGKTLSLYEELERIEGINTLRIDRTWETPEEMHNIINKFKSQLVNKDDNYLPLTTQNPKITKGHFKRGV